MCSYRDARPTRPLCIRPRGTVCDNEGLYCWVLRLPPGGCASHCDDLEGKNRVTSPVICCPTFASFVFFEFSLVVCLNSAVCSVGRPRSAAWKNGAKLCGSVVSKRSSRIYFLIVSWKGARNFALVATNHDLIEVSNILNWKARGVNIACLFGSFQFVVEFLNSCTVCRHMVSPRCAAHRTVSRELKRTVGVCICVRVS